MDLVRNILLKIESEPTHSDWINLDIQNYTPEEISYHVMLLREAGLIEADDLSGGRGDYWKPKRLTWKGHEFVEAARNDTIWNKAKETMMEKAGGIVFDVLTNLLTSLVSKAVLGS